MSIETGFAVNVHGQESEGARNRVVCLCNSGFIVLIRETAARIFFSSEHRGDIHRYLFTHRVDAAGIQVNASTIDTETNPHQVIH